MIISQLPSKLLRVIRRSLSFDFNNRHYERNHVGIELDVLENLVSTRHHRLLVLMLRKAKRNDAGYHCIAEGDYRSFGYDNRQNFYRDRKELMNEGYIFFEKNMHYIHQSLFATAKRGKHKHIAQASFILEDKSDFSDARKAYNAVPMAPPPKSPADINNVD